VPTKMPPRLAGAALGQAARRRSRPSWGHGTPCGDSGADYTYSEHFGKGGIRRASQCERTSFIGLILLALATSIATPVHAQATAARQESPPALLHTEGRHFVDSHGRVVILRGVNLSGDAKVPPFQTCTSPADLDRVADLGFNVVRMVFVWEAYESVAGVYNEAYLTRLQSVAAAAWERGIYVIIDIHQDGFSRHASRGAGDGFPRWAVSPRGSAANPDNTARSKHWVVLMATDPTTHKSFDDFYANTHGVRTRYLQMVARIAGAFAQTPGVIGYDLLNEPWGDERRELAPLYRDAAELIRAQHPGAIMFLEGHITTNCGVATKLPRPNHGNVVYAPHYYRPLTIALSRWHGMTLGMNHAFGSMTATAQEWDAPLFLGEFGAAAETKNAGDYIDAIYDRMDANLASGAQWCYSPRWNEHDKDGWNAEDFSILDSQGAVRANFRPRPYPRITAGTPLSFRFQGAPSSGGHRTLEFAWKHRPELGATELFVPASIFPPDSLIEVSDRGMTCQRDQSRQILVCTAAQRATVCVRISASPNSPLSRRASQDTIQAMRIQ
jgi:endoglycosylceramidase